VAICVERQDNRRVTEPLAYYLRIQIILKQTSRNCGEGHRGGSSRQPGFLKYWFEVALRDVLPVKRSAFDRSEPELRSNADLEQGFGLSCAVLSQLLNQTDWQRNGPARAFCFGLVEVPAAAFLVPLECALDGRCGALEIDIRPLQCEEFSRTRTSQETKGEDYSDLSFRAAARKLAASSVVNTCISRCSRRGNSAMSQGFRCMTLRTRGSVS